MQALLSQQNAMQALRSQQNAMQLITTVTQTLPSQTLSPQKQVANKPAHSLTDTALTQQKFDQDIFSDDLHYDYDWDTTMDEDLQFLSSPPLVSRSSLFSNQTSSGSGSEMFTPPLPKHAMFQPQDIPPPPPPFNTPPKLFPVEQVMQDHPGIDVASLARHQCASPLPGKGYITHYLL